MNRRSFAVNVCLPIIAAGPLATRAQPGGWPARPVHYLVAAAPATPPDVLARLLAEGLTSRLAQAVVVENRAGAIGSIGLRALASAPADGYTIGALSMPWVVGTHVLTAPGIDVVRDLQAVSLLARNYAVLAVPAASPWRSVMELVATARTQPDAITYSSAGSATPGHLAAKLLEREANLRMRHLPYKGSVANVTALLAAQAHFTFGHPGTLLPHVRSGKVRLLATAAPRRLASAPEVPTMEEAGMAGVVLGDWQALVAPRGTPREIVERLHATVRSALGADDLQARLVAVGIEPTVAGPEELGQFVAEESRRWATLVRTAGITAD